MVYYVLIEYGYYLFFRAKDKLPFFKKHSSELREQFRDGECFHLDYPELGGQKVFKVYKVNDEGWMIFETNENKSVFDKFKNIILKAKDFVDYGTTAYSKEVRNYIYRQIKDGYKSGKNKIITDSLIIDEEVTDDYLEKLLEFYGQHHFAIYAYSSETESFLIELTDLPFSNKYLPECESKFHNRLRIDSDFYTGGLDEEDYYYDFLTTSGVKSQTILKFTVGTINPISYLCCLYSNFEQCCVEIESELTFLRAIFKLYVERNLLLVEEQYEQFFKEASGKEYSWESVEEDIHYLLSNAAKHMQIEAMALFRYKDNILSHEMTVFNDGDMSTTDYSCLVNSDEDIRKVITSVIENNGIVVALDLRGEKIFPTNLIEKELYTSNIVGVPVCIDDDVTGVIFAVNKFQAASENGISHSLKPIYINTLSRLSSLMSSSLRICKEQQDLKQQVEEQRRFLKVLLHEIRSPISSFELGAEIIIKNIESGMGENTQRRIRNKIEDIRAMGARLKHLVDCYNFHSISKPKDLKKISLLRDVVLIARTVNKPYMEKQHRVSLLIEDSTFRGIEIYSDANLLAIAVNALLDNAGKYSIDDKDGKRPVKLYAKRTESNIRIIVENFGYPIANREIPLLFEQDYRGETVRAELIEGTGIGLYISNIIIKNLNGALSYIPSNNPNEIKFEIMLPLEPLRND